MTLSRHAVPSTLLHVLGQSLHGLGRERDAFTPVKRRFRFVQASEKLCALTLTFFPQQERFRYRILSRRVPPGGDCLLYECRLSRGQLHRHLCCSLPLAAQA